MREGLFDHHRGDSAQVVSAGAFATAKIGPCPDGYVWYVEAAVGAVIGNSHTALYALLVQPDDGLLPAAASADFYGARNATGTAQAGPVSVVPTLPVYVPPLHWVKLYAFGGSLANGDVVTFNVQVAVHQLDPHFIMSPDDAVQVERAHERMAAELNQDAVGPRAN